MSKQHQTDHLLRSDGGVEQIAPEGDTYTLKALQALVGGDIRLAPVPDTPDRVLVVDENGLPKRLPLNPFASVLGGQTLVGDVLLMHRDRFPQGDE